jgi:hypothetical protein
VAWRPALAGQAAAALALALLASPRMVTAQMARRIPVVVVVVRKEGQSLASPAAQAAPV